MPFQNNFRHQRYTAEKPKTQYERRKAEFPPSSELDEYAATFCAFGKKTHGKLDAIYLLHGTFVGGDAFGWNEQISKFWPNLANKLTELGKQFVSKPLGTSGNYTQAFANQFQDSIQKNSGYDIPVRLFNWSGENTHVARSRAAINFLGELLQRKGNDSSQNKVLVWCHSHAGNVLAIVTNLLGADDEVRETFLEVIEPTFAHDDSKKRIFELVATALSDKSLGNGLELDIVTFGTPIRYGWDTSGYRKLLHLIHHQPQADHPDYLAPLPKLSAEILNQIQGDFVQQSAIATTNLMPFVFDRKLVQIENQLGKLLQQGIERGDFLTRLKLGMRVPAEGMTLLVGYSNELGLAKKMAGHAIYTRPEWLVFHAKETANRLYGS